MLKRMPDDEYTGVTVILQRLSEDSSACHAVEAAAIRRVLDELHRCREAEADLGQALVASERQQRR